jgi:hypothetical protein
MNTNLFLDVHPCWGGSVSRVGFLHLGVMVETEKTRRLSQVGVRGGCFGRSLNQTEQVFRLLPSSLF